MCRLLVAGIADLVYEVVRARFSTSQDDAVEATRSSAFVGTVTCVGCKQHRRRDDALHDRGPGCKFPDDEAVDYSCPAYVKRLPRADPKHVLDPTCRWSRGNDVAHTRVMGEFQPLVNQQQR